MSTPPSTQAKCTTRMWGLLKHRVRVALTGEAKVVDEIEPSLGHAFDSASVVAFINFFPYAHAVQEADDSPEHSPVAHI